MGEYEGVSSPSLAHMSSYENPTFMDTSAAQPQIAMSLRNQHRASNTGGTTRSLQQDSFSYLRSNTSAPTDSTDVTPRAVAAQETMKQETATVEVQLQNIMKILSENNLVMNALSAKLDKLESERPHNEETASDTAKVAAAAKGCANPDDDKLPIGVKVDPMSLLEGNGSKRDDLTDASSSSTVELTEPKEVSKESRSSFKMPTRGSFKMPSFNRSATLRTGALNTSAVTMHGRLSNLGGQLSKMRKALLLNILGLLLLVIVMFTVTISSIEMTKELHVVDGNLKVGMAARGETTDKTTRAKPVGTTPTFTEMEPEEFSEKTEEGQKSVKKLTLEFFLGVREVQYSDGVDMVMRVSIEAQSVMPCPVDKDDPRSKLFCVYDAYKNRRNLWLLEGGHYNFAAVETTTKDGTSKIAYRRVIDPEIMDFARDPHKSDDVARRSRDLLQAKKEQDHFFEAAGVSSAPPERREEMIEAMRTEVAIFKPDFLEAVVPEDHHYHLVPAYYHQRHLLFVDGIVDYVSDNAVGIAAGIGAVVAVGMLCVVTAGVGCGVAGSMVMGFAGVTFSTLAGASAGEFGQSRLPILEEKLEACQEAQDWLMMLEWDSTTIHNTDGTSALAGGHGILSVLHRELTDMSGNVDDAPIWWTVCGADWDEAPSTELANSMTWADRTYANKGEIYAHLICSTLGYPAVLGHTWCLGCEGTMTDDVARIGMSEVECKGNEIKFTQCRHRGGGGAGWVANWPSDAELRYGSQCDHSKDVGIQCNTAGVFIGEYGEGLRLVEGDHYSNGRVEYSTSQGLHWLTVCQAGMSDYDAQMFANMICAALGFSAAPGSDWENTGHSIISKQNTPDGVGDMESIGMTAVKCSDGDTWLQDCDHRLPYYYRSIYECDHTDDIGVSCNTDSPPSSPGGPAPASGASICSNCLTITSGEGSGGCIKDSHGCITDGGGPDGSYNDNEACGVRVDTAGKLSATEFDTEANYDKVTINGVAYSGNTGPDLDVNAGDTFSWASDGSVSTGSGWRICLYTASSVCLKVTSGNTHCHVDDNGCVTDGTGNHDNNEQCTISILCAGSLSATEFVTEANYDKVTINDVDYSGPGGPQNVNVNPGDEFKWASDGSVNNDGWVICLTPS